MTFTKPGFPIILLSFVLAACPVLLAQYVPSSLAERLSKRDLFTQMSELVQKGDIAAAEDFIRENRQALSEELDQILDDVDRGFATSAPPGIRPWDGSRRAT